MKDKVVRALQQYSMLNQGDSVIVALSGGADSVALLNVICSFKEKYNLKIYAAHLNHGIRGEEAERDENFCKILCDKLNVELFTKHINIRQLAKAQKISEELCGRNERYSFFEDLSRRLKAKIATAHTASDNAETVLFNLARGSSLGGISGILPVRDNIIRPLIYVTRAEVEQYCKENNLDYVTDSTNLTDDYTRNHIRHNVILPLKKINPNLEQAITRLSENAMQTSAYINTQTKNAIEQSRSKYGFLCKKLLSYDEVIVKTSIVMLCKKYADFSPEHRHIELIIKAMHSAGATELYNNCFAVVKQGVLRFDKIDNKNDTAFLRPFKSNDNFIFGKKSYSIKNNSLIEKRFKNAVFRTRKSKDTFECAGRNINKSLRKLMNELKIPSEKRDALLLLADGNEVLWCEEIGVSKTLYDLNICEENLLKCQ